MLPNYPKETDITTQFSTSGARYTTTEDCLIVVRFYKGFCEVEGAGAVDDKNVFSCGSGTSTATTASQPNTIKAIYLKNASLVMWVTATIVDVRKYSCN